jgi:hypothetical protein
MTTTNEPVTEQWLSQTLAGLGTDADQVAATLRAAKITGERCDPSRCPVARYLTQRARERWSSARATVTICGSTATVGIDLPDTGYRSVQARPPEAVQKFITAFDTGGAYIDLIAEPAA